MAMRTALTGLLICLLFVLDADVGTAQAKGNATTISGPGIAHDGAVRHRGCYLERVPNTHPDRAADVLGACQLQCGE